MRTAKETVNGEQDRAGTVPEKIKGHRSGSPVHRFVYVSGVLVMKPAGTSGKEAAGSDETGREDEIFPHDEDAE